MSGGSFEYLCWKDAGDLISRDDLILKMGERLTELGYSDAGSATIYLYAYTNALQLMIDKIKAELEDIWHAVEWHDSGDSGIEVVKEAVEKWKQSRIKEEQ